MQKSILSSINTILVIGGFVMIFSVIISILNSSKILNFISIILSPIFKLSSIPDTFIAGILTGIIELTNGVSVIAVIPCKTISINIIICAFLLGFGGISVLLQVLAITSTSDISIKPYIIGKIMQGSIAALYTYIAIQNIPFLHFDI